MSAILKSFSVQLNRKQAAEIRKQLSGMEEQFYTLAVQIRTKSGPFPAENGNINFAALSRECGDEIARVLLSHRPPKGKK